MAWLLLRMPWTATHGGEVARVAGLERVQEFLDRASSRIRLVKLYGEFHGLSTSILMCQADAANMVFRWSESKLNRMLSEGKGERDGLDRARPRREVAAQRVA